jgi:enoyl-CoA hydratase
MSTPAETFVGTAVTLEWPEAGIALARMTREREMNTLTLELIAELARALDIAERDKARAFIITGTGRAFCCGAHLTYFTDPDSLIGRAPLDIRDRYLKPIALLFDRFETMAFPVIAAINGFALGGGCEMAISADFRVMSLAARIGTPEVRLGATPGAGGVQKLQRLVGRGKALEWILLGSHVSAEEADRHGLLFAATAPDDLMATALELARRLKALSPLALAQAKASIYVSESVDLASARRFGLEALTLLIDSADWREGMRAFIDKREPRF